MDEETMQHMIDARTALETAHEELRHVLRDTEDGSQLEASVKHWMEQVQMFADALDGHINRLAEEMD